MANRSIVAAVVLFAGSGIFISVMGQSLSPGHWTTEYVRFLQHRGLLWNLSPSEMPYSVEETRFRIAKGGLRIADGGSNNEGKVGKFVERFEQFLAAMPEGDEDYLVWLQSANTYHSAEHKELYTGRQCGTFGIRLRSWLEVYDTFILDNRLDENPKYMGKRQSGYASDSEQAYALLSHNRFQFKLGRDYIRWGPGRDATLLVSDNSRPMDHVHLSYTSRYFAFSYFTASLDATQNKDGERQHRYLSAHRLEVRPWRRLYIGISEAILYGGPNFSYDLAYLNPFIFYHGVLLNGPGEGNTIGSLSLAFMPKRGCYLYGDLLIDDMQIEKEGPGDLEPNELGYVAGMNISEPFGLWGLDLYGDYTKITNRTYNAPEGQWAKWLHRNEPIGHFLGNDFDRLLAGASYWPVPEYRFALGYERRRRGEGRIEKAFDTPWMNVPVGQEYHEPFPTGIVEKSNIWRLDLSWQPRWWLRIGGTGQYWDIVNRENVKGESAKFWEWNVSVEVDWVKTVAMR